MDPPLSSGCLEEITNNFISKRPSDGSVPVLILQVLNIKELASRPDNNNNGGGNNQTKFRAMFTDGKYSIQGILIEPTIINYITSGIITRNSIIKVLSYSIKVFSDKSRRLMWFLMVSSLQPLTEYGTPDLGIGIPPRIDLKVLPVSTEESTAGLQHQISNGSFYGNNNANSNSNANTNATSNVNSNVNANSNANSNANANSNSNANANANANVNSSNTNNNTVKVETYESKPPRAPEPLNLYNNNNNNSKNNNNKNTNKPSNLYPIEEISPYQNNWTIRARVINKSDIKTWSNQRGDGKLFNVVFMDDTGEIRATGFNTEVDRLYDSIEEGKTYYISKCRVNISNKKFSTVQNEYELMFDKVTTIELCENQDDSPKIRYNFVKIHDISEVEPNTTIDVIGVLKEIYECSQILSKASGKPFDKREIVIVDNSNYSIRLTLWNKVATQFDVHEGNVISFKGVKVSDFGGRSLSILNSTIMEVNPDIPESHELVGWYRTVGSNEQFSSHNSITNSGNPFEAQADKRITLNELDNLDVSEKPEYFSLKATIAYIRQKNAVYPSCGNEGCNKKLIQLDNGWRCEKCNQEFETPEYRYMLSVSVNDYTGSAWLSCFDEQAKVIMGCTAAEYVEMGGTADDSFMSKEMEELNYDRIGLSYIFRCRARMDTFNNAQQVRYQVVNAKPLDFASEANLLASLIEKYDITD